MRTVSLSLLALSVLVCFACDDDTPSTQSTDDTTTTAADTDVAVDTAPDDDTDDDTAPPSDTVDADTVDPADTGDTTVIDTTVDTAVDTDTGDVAACGVDESMCGADCCGSDEVCGTNTACCARTALCGSECCQAGTVCVGAVCQIDCGANVRCTDVDTNTAVCCAAGEICASGQCFEPTTDCVDFIDCPVDEYCEPSLGQCLPQPGGATCAEEPTGGAVLPTLLWHWDGEGAAVPTHNQVMMAPMVARIDADDVPDVVFISFQTNYTGDGILRVVSGLDGSSLFDVTDPAHRTVPGGQVALGDIDADGAIEIVACHESGALIAFERDGSLAWLSTDPSVTCTQAGPVIADLDADGTPEVFVRYTVLDGATGALEWHQDCVGSGGWATNSHTPCDYTTAADLDGDGRLEVIGGNMAWHHDGTPWYDRSADFLDGYPQVGDFDGDGTPEIVVVHSAFTPAPYAGDHYLRMLEADGTDRWGPVDINQANTPQADIDTNTVGGGGPATIANFDSDPQPEIALAGAYAYAVFEHDGTVKWSAPSFDRSSRKTGSSVFDFDGDGIAEAVYSDHYWLRVYDGPTGNVRYCECNTSATLWEYPVIVDVNADGHAEIVVASNDYSTSACPTDLTADNGLDACVQARIDAGEVAGTHGVRVFASPTQDWVGTRTIWNQHTYHVTNVAIDGQIPRVEAPSWRNPYLNNFRQNVQPGASNLPDVVAVELSVDVRGCPDEMVVNARLRNIGWSSAPAGTPATLRVQEPISGTWSAVGRVTTSRVLLPGESELVQWTYILTSAESTRPVDFQVEVNAAESSPLATLNECRTDNNLAQTQGACLFN